MEEFEILVKQMASERNRAEICRKRARVECGEDVYINFCCWCNGQANADRTNENDFKRFLQEEQIKLNQLKKIYLAKKYFNFIVAYDPIEEKWRILKNDIKL